MRRVLALDPAAVLRLSPYVGEHARELSPNMIVRLKERWSAEYDEWCHHDLSCERYVYFWDDSKYVNLRLEDKASARQCFLVLMRAMAEGTKELTAVVDNFRGSE